MKNKTILIVLSLLITAGLVPAAMAEAEALNRNLLYAQEDTYVADIESYQGQLFILRSEGLFAYDAAAGEEPVDLVARITALLEARCARRERLGGGN